MRCLQGRVALAGLGLQLRLSLRRNDYHYHYHYCYAETNIIILLALIIYIFVVTSWWAPLQVSRGHSADERFYYKFAFGIGSYVNVLHHMGMRLYRVT